MTSWRQPTIQGQNHTCGVFSLSAETRRDFHGVVQRGELDSNLNLFHQCSSCLELEPTGMLICFSGDNCAESSVFCQDKPPCGLLNVCRYLPAENCTCWVPFFPVGPPMKPSDTERKMHSGEIISQHGTKLQLRLNQQTLSWRGSTHMSAIGSFNDEHVFALSKFTLL